MNISVPTGLFDIVPKDEKHPWRSSHLWAHVETVIRQLAHDFAFEEIRTPLFERTELFSRSVGDETDIVSKEMYTFTDRGGRVMSLRPEGTASVIRSFVEKKMYAAQSVHRLFYIGPMFRYERPQSGRYRQHHQLGVEVVGIAEPAIDAEIIEMLVTLYKRLELKNLVVHVNSLGEKETRDQYRQALKDYLTPKLNGLSEDSRRRLEMNPLRILDSKDPQDQELLHGAPSILDFLDDTSRQHFESVQEFLSLMQVPFQVNANLVRGLDYYTKTVFEITSGDLGAQNTIGAGGRYDGLIKQLGGPDIPSIGFATGIERIIQAMLGQHILFPARQRPDVCLIPIGKTALLEVMRLGQQLREKHIMVDIDVRGKKVKQAMQRASEENVRYVIVVGDNEVESRTVSIKEMSTGESKTVPCERIVDYIAGRIHE